MSGPSPSIDLLVPHRGAMRLLDAVVSWDDQHAVCRASSHGDATNPLREGGRLSALAGIEYAAQAMAVHGGLANAQTEQPAGGYLISLRDVAFKAETLDGTDPVLTVRVDRIATDATGLMYGFAVRLGDRTVVRGRATVILTRNPAP